MFLAVLLMSFSTCDPFNKSVPIVHPRLVCADLKSGVQHFHISDGRMVDIHRNISSWLKNRFHILVINIRIYTCTIGPAVKG